MHQNQEMLFDSQFESQLEIQRNRSWQMNPLKNDACGLRQLGWYKTRWQTTDHIATRTMGDENSLPSVVYSKQMPSYPESKTMLSRQCDHVKR